MYATFDRIDICMTLKQAESCSQPGQDAEPDVLVLMQDPKIRRQRKRIDPELIRQELKEYGCYSEEELQDDDANWMRILWCAACDISEDHFLRSRGS